MGPFEIIMIILGALALILLGVLIFLTLKGKGQAVDSATIKKAVDESLLPMTKIISDSVERTNRFYIESVEARLGQIRDEMEKLNMSSSKSYVDLIEKLQASLNDMTKAVREENEKGISNLNAKFDEFSKNMSEKYALIDTNVAKALTDLRRENTEKLDSIQKTVDEKLQKTIDERLKTSFDNVVTQIGQVNNAIGSLRAVADDVGSLKNILTNVKTKGIVGEVILDSIIGEILSPDQYDKNVSTNKSSPRDMVEFAIKIPSGDSFIYLPIDSKFPLEYYNKLKDAVSAGDKVLVEGARKELGRQIKNEAKTIKKYIDVPNTTDFAILFLPTESLYIEAIEMGLFEECQREYHVNIAGPTTLSAIINALRLGFSSLEIQKRSGEVFKLLGAVKTEFNKFASALSDAQTKISKASDDLDELVGKRTRAMQRKLKEIGELPDAEAKDVFDGE
ncbi:MAG: DNA recombination protein RmuC [Clostridia bacterium]|nr:DNA recombination protein RmuC [Clostridia bacterium]